MRTHSKAAALAVVGTMTALAFPPMAAASSGVTTFHGTWSTGTNEQCEMTEASGPWTVLMKSDGTASVSSTVLLDGKLHAAWGGVQFTVERWKNDSFELTYGPATLELKKGIITFTVPDRYACGTGVLQGTRS